LEFGLVENWMGIDLLHHSAEEGNISAWFFSVIFYGKVLKDKPLPLDCPNLIKFN
jgi:hypothetical protein